MRFEDCVSRARVRTPRGRGNVMRPRESRIVRLRIKVECCGRARVCVLLGQCPRFLLVKLVRPASMVSEAFQARRRKERPEQPDRGTRAWAQPTVRARLSPAWTSLTEM